jgi:hypothetical protein
MHTKSMCPIKNGHTGNGHIVKKKFKKCMYKVRKEGGLGHLMEGWLGQPDLGVIRLG